MGGEADDPARIGEGGGGGRGGGQRKGGTKEGKEREKEREREKKKEKEKEKERERGGGGGGERENPRQAILSRRHLEINGQSSPFLTPPKTTHFPPSFPSVHGMCCRYFEGAGNVLIDCCRLCMAFGQAKNNASMLCHAEGCGQVLRSSLVGNFALL